MFSSTKYYNPTAIDAVLQFFVSPGDVQTVRIPAGGSADIPSQFEAGIHDIKGGVIVGGLAPFLVREGQTERVLRSIMPTAPTVLTVAPVTEKTVAPADKPAKK
jgi:hypothetical protein